MADLLQTACDWLGGMRLKHASQSVTYCRGESSVEAQATLGRTDYEVADESGLTVQAVATDFLISAEQIVLDGVQTLPRPGDRIRLGDDGQVTVYEVLDLAGGGHYRPSDPYGRTLRIHTKQVDVEI
ncbi:MAG TPA: hypothetical protein PKG77_20190 [Phycisphaerae bacterium]|nr:hypothetical protein [Phycisphaerae bacterium]